MVLPAWLGESVLPQTATQQPFYRALPPFCLQDFHEKGQDCGDRVAAAQKEVSQFFTFCLLLLKTFPWRRMKN